MRRFTPIVLCCAALAALLVAGSCATASRPVGPDGEPLSAKLRPHSYYEEGDLAFIGVDTQAASFHEEGEAFPVLVGIGNLSGGSLTVNRESFRLEDDQGNEFAPISINEFNEEYVRSSPDERLAAGFLEALSARYANFGYRWMRFFPVRGSGRTAIDTLEIGRRMYSAGYLYFPVPEGGIEDRTFRLLAEFEERPETYVVRFVVD
jgi:hypothetical protein